MKKQHTRRKRTNQCGLWKRWKWISVIGRTPAATQIQISKRRTIPLHKSRLRFSVHESVEWVMPRFVSYPRGRIRLVQVTTQQPYTQNRSSVHTKQKLSRSTGLRGHFARPEFIPSASTMRARCVSSSDTWYTNPTKRD
eukprot:2659916-Prymnesium_polylepis.1